MRRYMQAKVIDKGHKDDLLKRMMTAMASKRRPVDIQKLNE